MNKLKEKAIVEDDAKRLGMIRYSHKIWVPSVHEQIIKDAIANLCNMYDGCTVYDAQGFWIGSELFKEPVKVIEVIANTYHINYISNIMRQKLYDEGEEAVLVTRQEITVENLFEDTKNET